LFLKRAKNQKMLVWWLALGFVVICLVVAVVCAAHGVGPADRIGPRVRSEYEGRGGQSRLILQ
jgi:hypothetical protein